MMWKMNNPIQRDAKSFGQSFDSVITGSEPYNLYLKSHNGADSEIADSRLDFGAFKSTTREVTTLCSNQRHTLQP